MIPARPQDAVLLVNYFGLRCLPDLGGLPRGVTLIEDHTHDPVSPWAWKSRADYCIASLRKTLPVPDGGALWSPTRRLLPEVSSVTSIRSHASGRKLAAMLLKALYLSGAAVEKPAFRAEATGGEQQIAAGEVSGITPWSAQLLKAFPLHDWWSQRRRNHNALAAKLDGISGVEVLRPQAGAGCPSSAYLLLGSVEVREMVRDGLCSNAVFPAVLWSLEQPIIAGVGQQEIDLSRRALSVHCDFRYGASDMARIAALIERLLEQA